MIRVPVLLSMATAGMLLTASPLASATVAGETPAAQSADMLTAAMCGNRDDMVAELKQQYHEDPMAVGQVDDQAVIEILASENGSWTILATGTDGVSCIVSAGESFESTTLVRGLDV